MSDDLIRRQDAIDAIEILLEQSEDDEHDKTWNNAIRGSINAVKHHVPSAQPTIDAVEVKHGEWNQIEIIDDDSENGVNDDASQCSVCGYVFDSHYWAKTYFNYCPNCGAKMDVTQSNDSNVLDALDGKEKNDE